MPEPTLIHYDTHGGFADSAEARALGITVGWTDVYHPGDPQSAAFTWWTRPHFLALDDVTCDKLRDLADELDPRDLGVQAAGRAENYDLVADVLADLAQVVTFPAVVANALWWRLDIDHHSVALKRYADGHAHLEHQDLGPLSMRRKTQTVVQISKPEAYRGGDLQIRYCGQWITAPRERGAVVAFPAWMCHRVLPIEAGVRWSLIVTGYGEPIR